MTETTTNPKAELTAMQAVADAIAGLDATVAERVLRWALESHGIASARKESPAGQGAENNGSAPRFESLAELHDAASPETDADRALVGGYWFQFIENQPDFGSQQVNTALKNLGHPVANITSDTADGPMVLLDLTRAKPRVRTLANGVNPAWASS